MPNKKHAAFVLALVALLACAIIILARFSDQPEQAQFTSSVTQASTADAPPAPITPRESAEAATPTAPTSSRASAEGAPRSTAAPADVSLPKSTRTVREKGDREEEDAEARDELILRRNGKELRVEQERRPGARTDEPAEAMQSYLQKRLPPGEKELPIERYFSAREKIRQMQQFSTPKNELLPAEANLPKGANGTQAVPFVWSALGPGNVGGRTRALIIDPVTPNTMYAAGVSGGIWKTTNGGAAWAPLDDFMANIAVTCMAFEPGNPAVIYAGTGEGFFNADAVRGAGIFKSTNSGATWTRLGSSNTVEFQYVNDIVVGNGVNSQHVYAATRTGVWRSLDGGVNWSMILNVPTVAPSATGVRGATDLAIRTDQVTDYLFVGAGTAFNPGEPASHIYRHTDAATAAVVPTGTTPAAGSFTDVYTEADMGRTSLAIAPSNQNVIYAMSDTSAAGNYNLGLLGVFRSTSSGDVGTWTTQVRNTSANKQDTLLLSNTINALFIECGFGATNTFLNQGWYDSVLAVDPTDQNKVWAGGIDVWRSDNGGVNWGVASYWWFQGNGTPPNNGDPQLVHADNHAIVFHPNYNGTTNQTLFIGDDGGIYKTDNAKDGNVGYVAGTTPSGGTVTPTSPVCGNEFTPGGFYTVPSPVIWGPLNNGFAVTQFWGGIVYPNGTTYFGGTQDNGTNRGTDAAGPNAWERILGGDGGYVAVDTSNTNVLYAENTGNSFQKSTNGGASFAAARTGISGDTFPFTSVFRMDPNNPARLWYAGRYMWRTDNSAANWTRTSDAQQTGGSITAIAIATGNSDVVIDGAASGQIRRTSVATTATSTSVLNSTWLQSFTPRGNGFGGISWVEYDPTNSLNVWATVSNFNSASSGNGFGHVFKSADGGATWTLADGNQIPANPNAIPDIPAHSIAIAAARIYVGTDLGVFVTLDGGSNWYKEGGFPNVVTESLGVVNVGGQYSLYAFTHGRGAFRQLIIPTAAAAAISGVVTGPDGHAVAGATVTLSGAKSARTVTDSQGHYSFTGVETDNFYVVTPSLVNYHFSPAERSFSLLANKTDAVFTASPDAVIVGNAIDSADFFVRQHYLDFLGREPDQSGFNFWSDQVLACGGDAACIENKRINVSAAYFLSIEFQATGAVVDSLYRVSYGRRPSYGEFMPDRQAIAQNIIVGVGDWSQQMLANKQAFVTAWADRPAFHAKFDALSNSAFVDALIANTGNRFVGDRNALANGLDDGSLSRTNVLLQVAENEAFVKAKSNETFVMMEYFGYLRRDADESGFQYWLEKLNRFDGDFQRAEMVKAFITSIEYRQRFGQ